MEYEWDDYGIYPEIRSGIFLRWKLDNSQQHRRIHPFLMAFFMTKMRIKSYSWRVSKGKIIEVNGRFARFEKHRRVSRWGFRFKSWGKILPSSHPKSD